MRDHIRFLCAGGVCGGGGASLCTHLIMYADAIPYTAGALLLRGRKPPSCGLTEETRSALHDRARTREAEKRV